MKKILRKLASVALSIILIVSVMTVSTMTASAAYIYKHGDFEYQIAPDNSVIITRYIGNDWGTLTIPETLNGKTVIGLGNKILYGNQRIDSVVIPKTITYTDAPFEESWIHEATLMNGMQKIPDDLFCNATYLFDVSIPETVTEIGVAAFSNCTWLQTKIYSSNLDSIGDYAFFGCENITSISIPANVGKFAFAKSGITEAYVKIGVTKVPDQAFRGAEKLNRIYLNTATEIGDYAFAGCTALSNVIIADDLKTIGSFAFEDCASLKSIYLPDTLTKIGERAFYNTGMLNITIPASVKVIENQAVGYKDYGDKVRGFVIYGYTHTATEEYAKANGIACSLKKTGDVNKDDTLDINDATILQLHLAGYKNTDGNALINTIHQETFKFADANADRYLDANDVTYIQMIIADLI